MAGADLSQTLRTRLRALRGRRGQQGHGGRSAEMEMLRRQGEGDTPPISGSTCEELAVTLPFNSETCRTDTSAPALPGTKRDRETGFQPPGLGGRWGQRDSRGSMGGTRTSAQRGARAALEGFVGGPAKTSVRVTSWGHHRAPQAGRWTQRQRQRPGSLSSGQPKPAFWLSQPQSPGEGGSQPPVQPSRPT